MKKQKEAMEIGKSDNGDFRTDRSAEIDVIIPSFETVQDAVAPYGKVIGFTRGAIMGVLAVITFNEPIDIFHEWNRKPKSIYFNPYSGHVGNFGFFVKDDSYPFSIAIWSGSDKKYRISSDKKTFVFSIIVPTKDDRKKTGFDLLPATDQQKETNRLLSIFFERLAKNGMYSCDIDGKYTLNEMTKESIDNELVRMAKWWHGIVFLAQQGEEAPIGRPTTEI